MGWKKATIQENFLDLDDFFFNSKCTPKITLVCLVLCGDCEPQSGRINIWPIIMYHNHANNINHLFENIFIAKHWNILSLITITQPTHTLCICPPYYFRDCGIGHEDCFEMTQQKFCQFVCSAWIFPIIKSGVWWAYKMYNILLIKYIIEIYN